MEIHKPKPVHNFGEWLTEIGIVVIGVGIALAGEQTVEWLHWRAQVKEARTVMATELAYNVEAMIIRLRAEPCIERRFDELAQILDSGSKSGSLAPVGDIGMPPRNAWLNGAWESVVASQTAAHFPPQQLADISHAYKSIEQIDREYLLEEDDWHDLYAIVGPGRRLDPASEANLRKALSRARASNRAMVSLSGVTIGFVKNLNLPFSPADLAGISNAEQAPLAPPNRTLNERNSTKAICSPMGEVPATYGQAQFSYLPPMVDGMVKSIPDFSR